MKQCLETTHVEHYDLADCVEEIIPLNDILSEFAIKMNSSMKNYERNSRAVALSINGKHTDISYDFVCEIYSDYINVRTFFFSN